MYIKHGGWRQKPRIYPRDSGWNDHNLCSALGTPKVLCKVNISISSSCSQLAWWSVPTPFWLPLSPFFFWLCPWHKEASRPGIEPVPQQRPEPQQWKDQILNLLSYPGTHRMRPSGGVFQFLNFQGRGLWPFTLALNYAVWLTVPQCRHRKELPPLSMH